MIASCKHWSFIAQRLGGFDHDDSGNSGVMLRLLAFRRWRRIVQRIGLGDRERQTSLMEDADWHRIEHAFRKWSKQLDTQIRFEENYDLAYGHARVRAILGWQRVVQRRWETLERLEKGEERATSWHIERFLVVGLIRWQEWRRKKLRLQKRYRAALKAYATLILKSTFKQWRLKKLKKNWAMETEVAMGVFRKQRSRRNSLNQWINTKNKVEEDEDHEMKALLQFERARRRSGLNRSAGFGFELL